MTKIFFPLLCLSVLGIISLNSCSQKKEPVKPKSVDIQGHRGARGLMPENTIPSFLEALKVGVNTLELDLAVTKDMELLVSHEPYMNSTFCLDPEGNEIAKEDELSYNIYQMSYQEIKSFDCGTKAHTRFPEQQKFKVKKPLLKKVVDAVDIFLEEEEGRKVKYNIEIKSSPKGDNTYHPIPSEYSDLVYDFIQENMKSKSLNVQSFDFRILQYFHSTYPDIELAVLIGNDKSINENLNELGFIPEIYSCDYKLLTESDVSLLHEKGMKVIPWTINESMDMKKMLDWGVDGIITDYPNRAMELMKK
ncbi:MAG: glycerophosphodiester phosphodiesterase [Cyclobacteriaceae bacterium]